MKVGKVKSENGEENKDGQKSDEQQGIFEAVHYWLRPIERGKLVFRNFTSHFIRVQIFQIDFALILSASKYFR